MKQIKNLLICLFLTTYIVSFAQEAENPTSIEKLQQETEELKSAVNILQKLKISGYIQTQFQHGQEAASLKVGSSNSDSDKAFNRIGIRRGRLKFIYEEGIASGVFQLDITDKGVNFKDAYLNIKDPWSGRNSLRAGVFNRPFGYEISYSSSQRESPERSMIFQTLFPDERDLGGMLKLQPSKESSLSFLKLEAGLFAGNGIKQETDNRKDFIGHLSASKNIGNNAKFGLGFSYYNGGVYQGTKNVYKMKGKEFVLNDSESNIGEFAKREYFGLDGQFSIINSFGMTKFGAEYLWGSQPGTNASSKSPNSSTLPKHDTYIRNFKGGYLMLVQDLGETSPLSAVLKYDWYDPNTKVSNNDVGLNKTGEGDISYNIFGLGLLWRVSSNIRMQAYYEIVKNEKTDNITTFSKDRNDNVFTLRLQYKF